MIQRILTVADRLIHKISFGVVIILVTLFALFDAPAIWGENFPQMQNQLMIYLISILYATFFARLAAKSRAKVLFDTPAITAVTVFFLAFFLSLSIFRALPLSPTTQTGVATSSFALVITHIFVVASNEEILFRAAVPDLLPVKGMAAQGVSAVLFGLFHWVSYSASWSGILFAIVAGLVFGWITERWHTGLIASIGVHAAWNLFVVGAVVIF